MSAHLIPREALLRLPEVMRITAPSYALGPRQPRWDRLALDRCFDGGVESTDPDQVVAAVVQDILRKERARRRRNP